VQFEIDRNKINELKNMCNYRKTHICQGTSVYTWGRWIKDKHSPGIRTLEDISKHSDFNSAELAIAILELRQEYLEKQSSGYSFERQVEEMSEEQSKELLIKLYKHITDCSGMPELDDFEKRVFPLVS
jgi:hypothetical protein